MAIKYLFPVVATVVLTACASHSSTTGNTTAMPEMSVAIKAFTDVCLKTAPSFANAKKEAVAYGISEETGFTKDTSMGMQVKSNKECVITTEKQKDQTLTRQFLQAVSQFSGTPLAKSVPTRVRIGNDIFIFHHDRDGGEAYVMLKAER